MKIRSIVMLGLFATSACQESKDHEVDTKRAWSKCLFELDKIEAIRGRNLDDFDKGYNVARNQFMMDCLAVEGAGPTAVQIGEMSDYKAGREKRGADDISLNNGKRQ